MNNSKYIVDNIASHYDIFVSSDGSISPANFLRIVEADISIMFNNESVTFFGVPIVDLLTGVLSEVFRPRLDSKGMMVQNVSVAGKIYDSICIRSVSGEIAIYSDNLIILKVNPGDFIRNIYSAMNYICEMLKLRDMHREEHMLRIFFALN
ncbi:hypothetical protein [Phenylobacterium sp.]|jgi:hypothetical protein|uniref:hypothetical protein n=1 Tax=Phenylobacterium sp. TaxID=1871053 RepID=UPI002E33A073|nr:hypothetical protein [Phenylobacterium sp.]HEX4713262.1 hypothetical protein [Phenylobacterium sp.]